MLFPDHSVVYQARRQTKLYVLHIYGLDPLLIWLEKILRGIPIYTMDMFNAPPTTETVKVEVYVDDFKPAITSLV